MAALPSSGPAEGPAVGEVDLDGCLRATCVKLGESWRALTPHGTAGPAEQCPRPCHPKPRCVSGYMYLRYSYMCSFPHPRAVGARAMRWDGDIIGATFGELNSMETFNLMETPNIFWENAAQVGARREGLHAVYSGSTRSPPSLEIVCTRTASCGEDRVYQDAP
jgi:hypothetical protein